MDRAVKEARHIFTPQNGKKFITIKPINENAGICTYLPGIIYAPHGCRWGLCTTLSFAFGLDASNVEGSLSLGAPHWRQTALALMVPVLSGYIALFADRTGLTPGLVGGVLATRRRFLRRDHFRFPCRL